MFFRKKRHPLEDLASDKANIIQHQLTRLNLAYRAKYKGQERVQRVEFVEPLIATPQEIRVEVDVNRLPRGVTISDLKKPDVVETLTVACRHTVKAEYKKGKGGGFWFVIELEERHAVPTIVKYSDMQRPSDAAPLTFPVGVGTKAHWEDLRDLPHLLIAGATKQGKSVMVNAIICSLARRLGPERLQLYLCDLKGGMELAFYEDLPHVQQFITRAPDLPAMLAALQAELERRTALLRGKARDLDGYNYQVGKDQALPYIVAVIDEIANAMLSSSKVQLGDGRKGSVAALSEEIMADLAARARAVGIHLIISTQRPSVDVVTGLIKANFPCRIAFGTASDIDSRVIIDDDSAKGLPPGRMKFRRNMALLELQAPYLSDADVKREVAAITKGEAEPAPESKEDRIVRECALLLDIAEASFGGTFPIRELAKHPDVVKHKLSRDRIEALAARLEQEGVLAKQFGPRPRRINPNYLHQKAQTAASVLRPASGSDATDHVPSQSAQPRRSAAATTRRAAVHEPQIVDSVIIAKPYADVRDAIKRLKYHGEQERAADLGDYLAEALASARLNVAGVVPVPLHAEREAERGYNQCQLLAAQLAARAGLPLLAGLERTRWTVPQAQLRAEYRAKNLAGAFAWSGDDLAGKTIVLVDDVISTGATVDACAEALKAAGAARVIALAQGRGVSKTD